MSGNLEHTATLQVLRLKGRVSPDVLAAARNMTPDTAAALLADLVTRGEATEVNGQFRLSSEGRQRLNSLVVEERDGVDHAALTSEYEAFHHLNVAFKEVVTDWQVRDGQPNDHTDAAYDAAVLQRLTDLDTALAPQVVRLGKLAPRLTSYPTRFARALENLKAGDLTWFARPIMDSYHTVWFELHEDLIGLLGLSRDAEAEAGRA